MPEYRNADQTVIFWPEAPGGRDLVLDLGHPLWDAAVAAGVAPFVPDEPVDDPNPVPAVVSRFQARAALMDAGLLADVEIAVADAGPLVQLAWAEATEWRRDSPTIAAIAGALSLTAEQLDDLFREAGQITA